MRPFIRSKVGNGEGTLVRKLASFRSLRSMVVESVMMQLFRSMPKSTQFLKKTAGSGRRLDLSIEPLESTQELLD